MAVGISFTIAARIKPLTSINSNPHPIFVIIFVGAEKKPFGIQKDFLCHRSSFYRDYFAKNGGPATIEHTVELSEASPGIFGLVQHYMYTGRLSPDQDEAQPSYETLVSLWKMGNKLGIEGLCDQTLDAMITCRRKTGRIPSTPLIVQVWKDTPEGSTIRTLLLTWAAEYLDSSGEAAENFAKSLPQEVLSELIMTVVSLKTAPKPQPTPAPTTQPAVATDLRKNVHYLDAPSDDDGVNGSRKHRRVSGAQGSMGPPPTKGPRTMVLKPQKRRTSTAYIDPASITTAQKLEFCADLLARMLSGPGKSSPAHWSKRAHEDLTIPQASGPVSSALSATLLIRRRKMSQTTSTRSSGRWTSAQSRAEWTEASTQTKKHSSGTCGRSSRTASLIGRRVRRCTLRVRDCRRPLRRSLQA